MTARRRLQEIGWSFVNNRDRTGAEVGETERREHGDTERRAQIAEGVQHSTVRATRTRERSPARRPPIPPLRPKERAARILLLRDRSLPTLIDRT